MRFFHKRTQLTWVIISVLFPAVPALAGQVPADALSNAMEEIRQLKEITKALTQRVEDLEKEVQNYKQTATETHEVKEEQQVLKKDVEELLTIKDALGHIEISGGVTTLVQGSSGNDYTGFDDSTDGSFTVDLNLATHFGSYGGFYVHLEGGDGDGLNNDVGSFSIPNYDAYATRNRGNQCAVTISEAFYEFSLLNEKLMVDAGKMDISVLFDENAAAGDETRQFLSNIFVKSMGLTIPEPDNFYCPAAMVTVAPVDLVEFRVIGASVEDDNWENLFKHGFLATQVTFKPKLLGRSGNYRFYGWWDYRNHLKNRDLTVANVSPTYDDLLADEKQKGWGISFDQEIVDGVTGFVRYSRTTDDGLARWNGDEWEMIPFDRLWTLGADFSGGLWQREYDALGIAFGRTFLTDDYKAATPHTADENYVEAYYRLALHERLSLSPDIQWIRNAGGNSRADDIYIFGVRAQLDF